MTTPHPPRAPGALPLLGHALPLLRNPLSFLTTLPAAGDLVQIRLGPWRAYVVCSPQLTHQLLIDDRTFDKGGPVIDRAREAIGDGVATCPHDQHRRQRRLNQPAFHQARMPGYAAQMTKHFAVLTDSWREGQIVDVLAALEETAIRILISTMFTSTALSEADLTEMLHDVMAISRGVFRRMFMPALLARLPVLGNRGFEQAHAHLRHVARKTIAHHRQSGNDHGDLLSTLVAAQDPDTHGGDAAGLSDDELTDTIISYFFAGAETNASLAAWAGYFTASHPDVEEELHAEVDRVLNGSPATHADLPHLDVASRIITETLRIRPPAGSSLASPREKRNWGATGSLRAPTSCTASTSPTTSRRSSATPTTSTLADGVTTVTAPRLPAPSFPSAPAPASASETPSPPPKRPWPWPPSPRAGPSSQAPAWTSARRAVVSCFVPTACAWSRRRVLSSAHARWRNPPSSWPGG